MQAVLAGTLQAVASGSSRHLRRYNNEDQPDLRRNSSPDTASITIGGNA